MHLIWEWCTYKMNMKEILERWRWICGELARKQWPEFMGSCILVSSFKNPWFKVASNPKTLDLQVLIHLTVHVSLASCQSSIFQTWRWQSAKRNQRWCGIELTRWNMILKNNVFFNWQTTMSFLNKIKLTLRLVIWWGESRLNMSLILVVFQNPPKYLVRRC